MQLKTHKAYDIRYTTDGSNPKENGGLYNGEIVLPKDCKFVRVAVYYKDEFVLDEDIAIDMKAGAQQVEIEDDEPLEYTLNKQKNCGDTEQAYTEFAKLKQIPGTFIKQFTVTISEKSNSDNYVEITSAKVPWDTGNLRATVEIIRESAFAEKDVTVGFEYKRILFATGAAFKQWVDVNKLDAGELNQKGVIKQ